MTTSVPAPASPAVAFSVAGVSKDFPGVRALEDVSLTGYRGEVLAICGANGAGKSTLARLISGQSAPSSGRIKISGYDKEVTSPADADDAGILFMHQEPVIVDEFTVEENLWLKQLSSAGKNRSWRVIPKRRREESLEALRTVGMHEVTLGQLGKTLTPGLRQMLALGRTQVTPHRILILDETTASTTEEHFKDVEALVERERAAGTCVIFVSHRMPEVFAMADRIAILRNGRLIEVLKAKETNREEVVTLMVGEAVRALEAVPTPSFAGIDPVLEVSGLCSGSARDINFTVHPGEIVGIYGLVGSGRSSIARSISGHQNRDSGTVKLYGQEVSPKSPGAALKNGIAYLAEDRRREGFVKDFSNGDNMTLATLGQYSKFGVLNPQQERRRVDELIERYKVKGDGKTLTRSLSGGNQQKVCLAKWIEAKPNLVVLDEPTKGIDIGSRLNIYQIVHELADEQKGVVVVSSEAEELLMICHRILVIRDGELVDEFQSTESNTDDLMRAALGGEL
ncbi:sugar ABC transporter ATP-binding protein [Arthrobacter psychrochitiniphilus]|uniref:sugar ABC transporter ATP-binding protein n=1 Tax=Arthrobacter psychrochitiniphilus TaxID=291045 RepID=UPI003F7C19C9